MSPELIQAQQSAQRRRRYLVIGLSVILLAAVVYFGPELREQEPNYYNPARTALVNARRRFETSLGHEQALMAQLRMAREDLDSAITQLAKAEDLDPADRDKIESLRAKLQSIEQQSADRLEEISTEQLHESYRELLEQMDALITELENRAH